MTENASLTRPLPTDDSALRREVADLIVQALNMGITGAEIDAHGPLYGEGLGLDSIDILEIALVVSTNYGIELRTGAEENQQIFGSLQQLVDHIAAHRTK